MMTANLFNFSSRETQIFMRCFISIDVEDETTRDNLVSFINKFREFNGVNPVRPENLHLTLLFLGDVNEGNVTELRENFVNVTDNMNVGKFTCSVEDVGVFPHMNYISVVWAGAKPERELNELHMNYTERITFTNEQNEGDFVPHITVSRVKYLNSDEKSALQELVRESQQSFGAFEVANVRLKKSTLTDEGPIYEDLAVCEL